VTIFTAHLSVIYLLYILVSVVGAVKRMTDPTSRQRGRPTETRKKFFRTETFRREINVWSQAQSGLGTKTY
jgi:hypothetical protein